MKANYKDWLIEQKYASGTVEAQLHRVGRVEDSYGNIDDQYGIDKLDSWISELIYSTEDKRNNRPNPSKIQFSGDIRTNLASYKSAIFRYLEFLANPTFQKSNIEISNSLALGSEDISSQSIGQKLSMERDMQAAIRLNIKALSEQLDIIDDGAERKVDSGFIDITCEDGSDNSIVVVELKAGKADSRAIGQILGYMGDIAAEEPDRTVHGILVAHEFDKRSAAAARVVPTLKLKQYSIEFRFEDKV